MVAGRERGRGRPPPPALFPQPAPAFADLPLAAAADAAARLEAFLPTVHVDDMPGEVGAAAAPLRPPTGLAAVAAAVGLPWLAPAPPPPPPGPPPMAWHPRRRVLAAAGVGGEVAVFEVGAPSPRGAPLSPAPAPAAVLTHEFAPRVTALAWRPHAAATLAAGCPAGVLLWRLPSRPPGAPAAAPALPGAGATATWLPAPDGAPVAALAWSPCGRLLAAASAASPGVVVWDVATATPTRLAPGAPHPPPCHLAWSPDGGRLLAGGADSSLAVWETGRWEAATWAPPAGGATLAGVAWAPAGDAALLALGPAAGGVAPDRAPACRLASLAFVGRPPSLAAHVLPVPLPGAAEGGAPAGLAWCGRAARAALAGGDGRVALLIADPGPVLSLRLIGSATLPAAGCAGGGDAVALAFAPPAPGDARGGLLAVRRGPAAVSLVPVGLAG